MNVRSMWRLCIETGWMPAALLIVALEYAVAVALGFSVGFQFSIPTKSYLISGLTVASFAVCAVCLYRLIRRTDRPASDLLEVVAVIVLVGLQMAVLGWLKAMLPHVTSFWADPMLADWDTTLFGTDPWRITQFLLGWATPLIDRTYVTWAPVKFATLLALAVAPPSDLRSSRFRRLFHNGRS